MKQHYSQLLYRAFWFDVGVTAARCLGVSGARRVGRVLGYVYAGSHPRTRRAVRSNLEAVYGPKTSAPLVYRTFSNFGAAMADYFSMGARPKNAALDLIGDWVGYEHIQSALADGKGALLVTVHTGLFELGSVLLEHFKVPLVVLSRREPSEALHHWRATYRRRWNAETLEVGEDQFSFVNVTRQLAQGKFVAMLIDRPRGENDAVPVEFDYGRVPFSTGPVLLSLLSGAPLVAVTILATPAGRYTLEAQPPLRPSLGNGDRAAEVHRYTVELANSFRQTICQHPDQWYQFVPLSAER